MTCVACDTPTIYKLDVRIFASAPSIVVVPFDDDSKMSL